MNEPIEKDWRYCYDEKTMKERLRGKAQRRQRKMRLWFQDPNCFWCGEPTLLVHHWPGPADPDDATLDHYWSRNNPRIKELVADGQQITVLAHSRCNHQRNHKNA